jgi:very-short-patch-repair endonuclease
LTKLKKFDVINYEQKKDKRSLNYDFYLPDLKVLIEHQGEQHYKPKNFGGISSEVAEKNFILQQRHDELKREFAKDNGFSLLEISYKDFENIEKILKKIFLTKKEKFDIINHKVERV